MNITNESMTEGRRGIVVGYDGSAVSAAALDWAAAEAERRHLVLTVLLAVEDSVSQTSSHAARLGLGEDRAHRCAAESVRRARSSASSVAIVVETHFGTPSHALIQKSLQADLVVLGVSGRNRPADGAAGPVALAVSAQAHCPVMVVGPDHVRQYPGVSQ